MIPKSDGDKMFHGKPLHAILIEPHRNTDSLMADINALYDEAHNLKEQGELEAAVAKLREVLEIDETHSLTHSALAVNLQRLGQDDDAIKHATRVTELEPNDAFSFTQLSVILQRCGKIQEAEDAMAKSREVQTGG